MTQFHSDEYVEFLARVTPGNMNSYIKEQHKCTQNRFALPVPLMTCVSGNVGDDCPVFDGLFEFCAISAGGSMGTLSQARIFYIVAENYPARGRRSTQPGQMRHCHKLGWWFTPREEE